MTSPLLDRNSGIAGAVDGAGVDAGVAAHYGDPLGEQRAMWSAGGIVDRSHRGVVRVSGADRLSWLHSLLSAHVADLQPNEHREALLLSAQGHVEQHMVITEDGESCWIDVEPGQAEALVAFLDSMRFMLRVEVSDVSAEWAVLTGIGEVPVVDDAVVARSMPGGTDLIVPRTRIMQTVIDSRLRPVGHIAFEAQRVAARRPRFGFDTDHRTIPHEVGWIDVAVHTNKGCYRGQETVARVHNLGHAPRRLVLCHFDGSSEILPPVGTAVEVDGTTVGQVGSTAWHAELGPIGLAVIKRNVATDAQLVAAGMAAAIDPDSDTLGKEDDNRPAVAARAAFRMASRN